MHRPTRDLDLLCFGEPDGENLASVFRDLCGLPVEEDGLEFRADTIIVEPIREDQEYGGWRDPISVQAGRGSDRSPG